MQQLPLQPDVQGEGREHCAEISPQTTAAQGRSKLQTAAQAQKICAQVPGEPQDLSPSARELLLQKRSEDKESFPGMYDTRRPGPGS